MQNQNVHNSRISQVSSFNNKIFDNGDVNNLDNVNIVNSPSDDFNVSSEIHVQKFGINQIGHELDLSKKVY